MYNPPYYQPPYYNIKYYDHNGNEITASTTSSSVQNETVTITQNLKVKFVKVTYNAILTFKLDDLIVGPAAPAAPSVTSASTNQFTTNSAVMGGNVTNEQLASVTDRGVVYNTSPTPTIANTKVQIGSGSGPYSQTVSGLTPGTLYYVRAYATNSVGTSYGTQTTFTTAPIFTLGQVHYFNTAWASTTSQTTPFTKYVEGWNVTATGTGSGLVSVSRITGTTGTSSVGEGTASARVSSSTSTEDLVSMALKASDNTAFDLQGFKFKYLTKVTNTAFATIKVTGYLNGVPVPGAVATLTNIAQASTTSFAYSTFDLGTNNSFNTIDQFIITAADPANGARLSAIDIDQLDVTPAATLPLTLENFSGNLIHSSCLLTWTTAQEQYTRNFDVEYSTDGSRYKKIGSVAAAGNSTHKNKYSFSQASLVEGNNYYRLKMNDIDDKYVYSQVVIVRKASTLNVLNVYPNPVNNSQISINLPSRTKLPQSFQIFDATGKMLQEGVITAYNQKADVSMLKNGNYFILLSDGQSQGILVQR
jgi:hypothetical protein